MGSPTIISETQKTLHRLQSVPTSYLTRHRGSDCIFHLPGTGGGRSGAPGLAQEVAGGESHPDLAPLPVHFNRGLCSIHSEPSREDWPLFLNIYYVTLVPLLEHHGHRPT